jgi:outer membrane receptor protein involved in Fe transport
MQRVFALGLGFMALAAHGQQPAEIVVVTGEFRESALGDLPISITVLRSDDIEARSARHLDEILALVPNVSVAGGSSRSRFFQIRGIGERGQFVEPLNPSVGLIVDGVDLSAAATAATLFDVEQVEVFRGPQGTRYGANALAGLINVRTRAPTDDFEARLGLDMADYDAMTVNGVVSGPVGERVSGRFAAQQHTSDGFIRDTYLGRDDTNARDELSLRGKLRWLAGDSVTVDGLVSLVDLDNGYDAFSFDNDRNTRSDEPGRDAQESVFAGVDVVWDAAATFTLDASVAAALSDSIYGYDEDWTYAGFHDDGYSSTDYYFRDRKTHTAEVRMLSKQASRLFGDSTDWVFGVYALDSDEDLRRDYTFAAGPFTSTFAVERLALFGQLESALGDHTRLTAGLRYERHRSDYLDSAGVSFAPDDRLTGWRLSLDRALTDALMGYVTLSRGYKAGGFNTDGSLPVDLRQYDPETLVNLELGLKGSFFDRRLQTRVALFHMARDDVQIASSLQIVRMDGSTEFISFTGNAAEGENRGIEAELVFTVNERFDLSAGLGLLDSEYEDFVNAEGEDLDGREQAHAPGYQFALSGRYAFARGWFAELGVEGRDAFYFSDSHDTRSESYEVFNAAVGFRHDTWDVRLWSRNLTDEDVFVRGYFFGNDPRIGYAAQSYTQLGEPRRVGLSVSRSFE